MLREPPCRRTRKYKITISSITFCLWTADHSNSAVPSFSTVAYLSTYSLKPVGLDTFPLTTLRIHKQLRYKYPTTGQLLAEYLLSNEEHDYLKVMEKEGHEGEAGRMRAKIEGKVMEEWGTWSRRI